jgi:hypothetical protein
VVLGGGFDHFIFHHFIVESPFASIINIIFRAPHHQLCLLIHSLSEHQSSHPRIITSPHHQSPHHLQIALGESKTQMMKRKKLSR